MVRLYYRRLSGVAKNPDPGCLLQGVGLCLHNGDAVDGLQLLEESGLKNTVKPWNVTKLRVVNMDVLEESPYIKIQHVSTCALKKNICEL